MDNLQQTIFSSFHSHSTRNALCIDGIYYSYQHLKEKVASLQNLITKTGDQNRSIGIIANHDVDTYAAIFACLLSGVTYIPIEPTHPIERINYIINSCEISRIFCSDTNLADSIPDKGFKSKLLFLNHDSQNSSLTIVPYSNNPVYVLFTSGSTGFPKGVPISFENLSTFIGNVKSMGLEINPDSRFLQLFELTFDLSVFSFLIPFLYGATLFAITGNSFIHVTAIQLIMDCSITHVLSVPSFVNLLKPHFKKISLPSVKLWLFCGESLKTDLALNWKKCLPNASILNVYGPTEATIFCTQYTLNIDEPKEYQGIVSIGKPFKDVQFFSTAEKDQNIENPNLFELMIGGSQITRGYIKNDTLNQSAFTEIENTRYYKTGDLCCVDHEGDYYFVARNDMQIKINGYRIEINEIEFHTRMFSGIEDTVVVVVKDSRSEQLQIWLAYTATKEINPEKLSSFLKTRIPLYMIPSYFHFFPSFPYNLNGKIDRKAIANIINQIKK